ncbi:MAG: hypothetical protein NTZ49_05910 [Candidatus Parcubacteria bacterium]|nr:hypothetical protein [Candidatus Parcubacteria bacterium]
MTHRHHINPPLNIYRKIALGFIVITAILIGVIFYFALSYAYITVYPKSQEVNTDFNFIVVENPQNVNLEEGIIVGKIINEELEDERTFPSTGTKILMDNDIVGRVRITNNLTKSQALVATTRLLTADNILFRLKNRVDIPAKSSIEAEVYADDPSQPLSKSGTKFTIPGLSSALQILVYAEAISDFNASGQPVLVVSQEDLDKALALMSDELAQKSIKDIPAETAKVLSKEIISQEFSNKVGDQVNNFKIKLKLRVKGVTFNQGDVKKFSQKALQSIIPTDKQVVADNSDKLIIELDKIDTTNRLAQLKSNVKGVVIISENSQILDRDKLIRLKLDEIKAYLENFEDIEKVEISFFPKWVKKMPFFQDHIIIRVNK